LLPAKAASGGDLPPVYALVGKPIHMTRARPHTSVRMRARRAKQFDINLIGASTMSARIRAAIFAALAAYGLPVSVWAQSVRPGELENAARQGEQLLRQQQQIQEERQRERDRERQQPAGQELPAAPSATPIGARRG